MRERLTLEDVKNIVKKASAGIKNVLTKVNMAGAPMGKAAAEIAKSQEQKSWFKKLTRIY